ncbi:MAG: hypothetical protein IPM25_03750 [Chloracidobacterium sp.]|nr:hypothetical protein [Chloracidobacterium sp.]
MDVLHRQVQFLLIAGLVTMGTIACGQENSAVTLPTDSNVSGPMSDVAESALPGVGKVLIKTAGWQIPPMRSDQREPEENKNLKAKTIDGIEVSVESTRYTPIFGTMLVPDDATAAIQLGELNVQGVSEYRTDGRQFAFVFAVNRIYIDKETNAVTGSQGVVFRYALYDEDGDNIFETLALSDNNLNRTLTPHVPTWAAVKSR